jgi:hypothetical protein
MNRNETRSEPGHDAHLACTELSVGEPHVPHRSTRRVAFSPVRAHAADTRRTVPCNRTRQRPAPAGDWPSGARGLANELVGGFRGRGWRRKHSSPRELGSASQRTGPRTRRTRLLACPDLSDSGGAGANRDRAFVLERRAARPRRRRRLARRGLRRAARRRSAPCAARRAGCGSRRTPLWRPCRRTCARRRARPGGGPSTR